MEEIKKKFLNYSGSYRYYKNHYDGLSRDILNKEREINYLKNELNSKNYEISSLIDKNNTDCLNEENQEKLDEYMIFDEKIFENQFVFSIIIPYYNSEKYLDRSIKSVIRQTINFKHNIQLILVDDGSTDNSNEIVEKYKLIYPKNIILLSQAHQNVSTARNNGLKHASGKYVNFLDSDDYLSPNALEEVFKFFIINDNIKVVSISTNNFGYLKENKQKNYLSSTFAVNLMDNPFHIFSNISSFFFSLDLIKEFLFDTKISYFEGIYFIYSVLLNQKVIGLVNSAQLNVRKRYNYSSINDNVSEDTNLATYINSLNDLCDNLVENINNQTIPVFVQTLLIHELYVLIKNYSESINSNIKKDLFQHVLKYVDFETIKNSEYEDSFKIYLIQLKNEKNVEESKDNLLLKSNEYVIDTFNDNKIFIENIKILDGTLNITGKFHSYFDKEFINIYLIEKVNDSEELYQCKFDKKESDETLFDNYTKNNQFTVSIPFKKPNEVQYLFKIIFDDETSNKEVISIISYNTKSIGSWLKFEDKPYKILFEKADIKLEKYFNFSIIMSIYNTGRYLNESINSVINQTLDFKENVQLILVDDGSSDNSYSIIKEYEKKYPDNIIVLKQENMGQAIARNYGISYIKGKYVNFLDSDDYISNNTLKEVLTFFECNYNDIDLVAIPLKMFGRINKYHILHDKFSSTRIIDLNVEPNNPQLSASSAFFKSELFPKFKFAENMVTSEDSIMINKILLEKRKYGVINTSTYYYRKRYDSSSTIDNSIYNNEFYVAKLRNYFLELIEYSYAKTNELPLFIQYLIAYDIQWIIQTPELSLLDKQNKKEFKEELYKIFGCLNKKVFLDNNFIENKIFKNYGLYLITNDIHVKCINDNVNLFIDTKKVDTLNNHNIWLDIVELNEDYLNISGFLNSYFNHENIKISAVKYDKNNNVIGEYNSTKVKYTGREDTVYLDQIFYFRNNFDIKVPLKENEVSKIQILTTYMDDSGINISNMLKVNFSISCISSISNYIVKGSHILVFEDNSFILDKYDYKKMRLCEKNVLENIKKSKPSSYKEIIKLRKLYLICYYLKRNLFKKQIFLFMDRINMAGDNAEELYKYSLKQKDNSKKYFVIGDDDEYSKLKKYGNIIRYKSFKHKLLYLLADKVISSHPDESVLNPFFDIKNDQRKYVRSIVTSKIYFLQHGVTLGNVSDWLHKFDKNLSLILTLSDKEHDSFLEEGYNYDEEIIQTLGFPRFDNLISKPKNQIVIMPTWRNYLERDEEIFKNSLYFKNIEKLLNNKELIDYLKNMGYTLVFKPHPRLLNKVPKLDKRYVDLFKIDDNVRIAKESYQQLFKESKLLITDYSSVAFDFAYLKKPIIYYQPNNDYHHGKSYFEFDSMGFGDVLKDNNQLYDKLKYYIENDCVMEDKYIERVNDFFKFNDRNNSKRVYDWIINH